MKSRWSLFTGIALAAAATGFLAGFLSTLPRATSENLEWWSGSAASPSTLIQVPDAELPWPVEAGDPAELMYYPETVLADAEALAPEESPPRPPRAAEPGILPQPASTATPLSALPAQQSGLEQLIDAEFSELSEQQREVWLEVLSGLPLEDAAGILRIWKQFGRGTSVGDPLEIPGGFPGIPSLPQVDAHAEPDSFNPDSPARAAIHDLRELTVRNLLNADTHGYRRYEPLLSDAAPSIDPAASSIQRLASFTGMALDSTVVVFDGWRIDQRPGEILITGNSMDVAISGTGFFVVTVGEETLYTRCGRFRRDGQGRLVLDQTQQTAVLQPVVAIPSDTDEVLIDADGHVHAVRGDADPQQIGRLKLATFRDPGRLQPDGGTLFRTTERSGPANPRTPRTAGTGSLQQRALESSNVNFEEELLRLEWLERLARVLE